MQRLINEVMFLLRFTWLSFLFFGLNKAGVAVFFVRFVTGFVVVCGILFIVCLSMTSHSINKP